MSEFRHREDPTARFLHLANLEKPLAAFHQHDAVTYEDDIAIFQ